MESSVALDQILCFKHRRKVARDSSPSSTDWRTLQLLPGKERPSYAGAQLEVHEGLDGQLLVQYRGRTIPTQEAPPRPGVLRASNSVLWPIMAPALSVGSTAWAATPRRAWHPSTPVEADSATLNGGGRVLASLRHRQGGRRRTRPRESWPPTGQHHDGDQDDLRGAAGPHSLRWNEPYASDRVVDGTGGDRPEPLYGTPHPGRLPAWTAPAAVGRPDTVSGANAWPKKGCCCR